MENQFKEQDDKTTSRGKDARNYKEGPLLEQSQ